MKQITTILIVLMSVTAMAQAPQKFNYQALARDTLGNPIANQSIAIRLSILSGSASGTSVYSEVHYPITDRLGLFALEIGTGTVQLGVFDQIDWGSNKFFLQTEIDISGGSTFTFLGLTQLLSVPYALHAKTLENTNFENNNAIAGLNAGLQNTGTNGVMIGLNAGANNTGVNNTFAGAAAGWQNTSGIQNVFIGGAAGKYNTTGNSNAYVGFNSGRNATTGGGNAFFGVWSGASNTTANHNTLIGNNAGSAVTTGSYNTMVGAIAGRQQTIGTENTYLGNRAAQNVTSGSYNTILGSYAGNNANGERNVFIGFESGYDDPGDDQLIIANGRDSANVLLKGNFVTGDLEMRGVLNTAGGIRFADGTVQNTAAINNNGVHLTNNNEIKAGASSNISIGNIHPEDPASFGNNIIGQSAGSTAMSGPYNVLIGQQAGQFSTTGTRNVFVGSFAGNKNTTGGYNVYIGTDAGRDNETGHSNTLVGNQAGTKMTGFFNTAVGRWAGYSNTTGRNNVFVGLNAGANNNGSENVMIGGSTAWQATGSKNVFLGHSVGTYATSHSSVFIGHKVGLNESRNNMFILGNGPDSVNHLITGDFISGDVKVRGELMTETGIKFPDGTIQTTAVTATNPLWLQNSDSIFYTAGNVGVGTASPTERLTVNGNIQLSGEIRFADGTVQNSAPVPGDTAIWSVDNSNALYELGNVGIGTNAPSEKLTVDGFIATTEGIKFPDGTIQSSAPVPGDTAIWSLDSTNTFYNLGNVGIGTSTPNERLTVDGYVATTAGIKFPDGTVQSTAAVNNPVPVKSSAAYFNFGEARVLSPRNSWAKYGIRSIDVGGPGTILVTYTGYNKFSFYGRIGIGLSSSSSPLNTPLQFQDNSKGGNDAFATKYGHRVNAAGTYSFAIFVYYQGNTQDLYVNDLTLLFIPD